MVPKVFEPLKFDCNELEDFRVCRPYPTSGLVRRHYLDESSISFRGLLLSLLLNITYLTFSVNRKC